MPDSRRVADPLFAPQTVASDLPRLVDDRRDETTLTARADAVERARRGGDDARRSAVLDALGLGDAAVPVESVPSGELDANGREPAARALVRRLDDAGRGKTTASAEDAAADEGASRWGVLTDGRHWRLYGGDDPDEERYREYDLRTVVAAGRANDDTGRADDPGGTGGPAGPDGPGSLRRFVALFAREAFDSGDADSFLDALAAADGARRTDVRASLRAGVAAAAAAFRDAGVDATDAAAVAVRLAFDLFVADRTGSPEFVDAAAFRAARARLVADPPPNVATDGTTDDDPRLDRGSRETLREWVARAAESAADDSPAVDSASADAGSPDPDSVVSALDDRTLERVCAGLVTADCGGRRVGVDYRTVAPRLLADAHERLVETVSDGAAGGPTTRRKAEGSFYTPESVVTYLAARTADPLVRDARAAAGENDGDAPPAAAVRARVLDRRVLDPAMGGGTLLVAVARRLAAGVRESARAADTPVESAAAIRRAVVSRCLRGVDRSPAAAAVARLCCLAATLGPETDPESLPSLSDRLRCGDALLGPGPGAEGTEPPTSASDREPPPVRWEDAFSGVSGDGYSGRSGVGFDAVVGNPPWKGTAGRADISARIDADVSAYLREQFDAAAGPQPNLYAAFLERACRLAPDGYVAFVVPDALLVRLSVAPARRFLLESGGLTHLLRVGNVFPDANEGAAVVVCGPDSVDGVSEDGARNEDGSETGCGDAGATARATGERGPVRTWFGDAEAFAAAVDDGAFEYGRLARETVASEEYARFQLLRDETADGIFRKLERRDPFEAVGSVARGEEFGKRDERLRDAPGPGTRRLVPGSAVRRYALRAEEVRHVPASAVSKDVYDPPKLLCRQTGRYLAGTLDTAGVVNLKSVYDAHARPPDGADAERLLKHVLGLVNSTVYNYYHYVRRNAYPAQFPQQNQRNYETLPVWPGAVDDELVALVDRRLAVGRERESLDAAVGSVVGFEAASVPLERFDPDAVDDGLSRSHRGETPGLRIADLSVREDRDGLTLRATFETDAGTEAETRDALRFDAPTPREAVVLSTWLPAVGSATAADRRACGLRAVGRSSQTTPRKRLLSLRVPDPATHAGTVARCARDRRRAATLNGRAATLDDRIDARVAASCGLTDAERARVRETMAAAPGWSSLRRED